MNGVNILENDETLVILFQKNKFNNNEIEFAKNLFSSSVLDTSHIPYVDDDEQQEIEELLSNPDCHEFTSKATIIL